jgi:ABC-type Fe3+-hydroxamate transport system substrate-binding protein
MGAADHLVAVSNFDIPREGTRNLPHVGDYQTTDWERLASLRPAAMITQYAPDRLPAGLKQKADELSIKLINVRINRLDDIFATMQTLGDAVGDAAKGKQAADDLRGKLDAIAKRSQGRLVRTLIVLDDAGRGVVGRNNYLDDVLALAGGVNVIRAAPTPYPSIDREVLIDLDPEVIFQLLPDATPQVRAAAQRMWQSLPQLRAVRDGRVHITSQWWAQLPTQHVAELSELFSLALNEARGSYPSSSTPAQRAGSLPSTPKGAP